MTNKTTQPGPQRTRGSFAICGKSAKGEGKNCAARTQGQTERCDGSSVGAILGGGGPLAVEKLCGGVRGAPLIHTAANPGPAATVGLLPGAAR